MEKEQVHQEQTQKLKTWDEAIKELKSFIIKTKAEEAQNQEDTDKK